MKGHFSFNISQVMFIFSFLYSGFLKIVYCSDASESQHDISWSWLDPWSG